MAKLKRLGAADGKIALLHQAWHEGINPVGISSLRVLGILGHFAYAVLGWDDVLMEDRHGTQFG